MNRLHELLRDLPTPDSTAATAVHERAAQILRPSGALAWLDELAEWIAGWQRTERPRVERPVGLIFSAYPTEVTAAMFDAYRHGRSTISAFARQVGATVVAVDVGIGKPTNDIRFEAALEPERFDEIVDTAVAAVDRLDGDLLVVGEMGIGNTTPSAPRWPVARPRRGSAAAPASTMPASTASGSPCSRPCAASPASPTPSRCCARSAGPSWRRSPRRSPPPATARCPSCSTATS